MPLLTEQMRAATREVHSVSDKLVNLKLVVVLMDKKLYGRALMLFYYVYAQLESTIKKHKNHEALFGFYKIVDEIARADHIAKDLQFYLGEGWSTQYQPTQATQEYVKYLKELAEKNPTLVLPYCYHMYMAMLAGGVMIKKLVQRSFTPPEGQGLNCFAFNVKSNKALRSTIKDIINATSYDEETKKLILAESVTCFRMNNEIVRSLDGTGNHVMKFILKWVIIIGLILATFFAFTRQNKTKRLNNNGFYSPNRICHYPGKFIQAVFNNHMNGFYCRSFSFDNPIMGAQRALMRNIMIFASEVPVISALNPYRQIEDVFLDVWRRTNPQQVSALQEQLAVSLLRPEEKIEAIVQDLGISPAINKLIQEASMAETIEEVAQAQAQVVQLLPIATPIEIKADVVQLVTSTMHKGFGVKRETAGIKEYEKKRKVVVQERNLKFSKKKVATVGRFNVVVGGKIDGQVDGKVIEVKNRLKKFLSPLPKYDIAQLQTYLYIRGVREGELVEHLHAAEMQTKMTKVTWDDKMWNSDIKPNLVRFGSALTYLMKDKTAQSDYLQSDSDQQREIIRYFWSQEVQRRQFVV